MKKLFITLAIICLAYVGRAQTDTTYSFPRTYDTVAPPIDWQYDSTQDTLTDQEVRFDMIAIIDVQLCLLLEKRDDSRTIEALSLLKDLLADKKLELQLLKLKE